MSAEPISSLYESACQKLPASSAYLPLVHPQTQLWRVSDRCGDAEEARKKRSDQDDWQHLLVGLLKKPTLIHCQAEQPNYITYRRRTVCLFPDSSTPESAFLSSHHWLRQRRWVSVSMVCDCLRIAMCAACYGNPYPSPYLATVWQWFCLLDCCQTEWTLAPEGCWEWD